MSAINIFIILFLIHLSIVSTTKQHLIIKSSSSPPSSSSSSSSPSSPSSSTTNSSSSNRKYDESTRTKRSTGDKWKETTLKSQCEVQCQCASQNSSSKRRQPQHEMIGRSLVMTEQQTSSIQCKSGVSKVMDGCGCCLVCARQQGDSCDKIHPCDALKQLFCDTVVPNKDEFLNESGICKPQFGEPCIIEGKAYKDGEQFQLNCSLSCSCQNGQYACASLCPQEERPPSIEHCGQAKLLSIAGRCCKEWVCPHPPQQVNAGLYLNSFGEPGYFLPGHTFPVSSHDSSRKDRCIKDVSQWSSCSATCGTGWSIHMTNDNENCKTVVERKMCYMRPCPPDEAQINPNASLTWNECHDGPELVSLNIEGCTSNKEINTTICNTCTPPPTKSNSTRHQSSKNSKKRKCCRPGQARTIEVTMKCRNGTSTEMKFRQIKTCRCKESYCKEN